MERLKRWLDRQGIDYSPTAEWSLVFAGNVPEGIYVDAVHERALAGYLRRAKLDVKVEWRGNYRTLYCKPAAS